MLVVLFVTSIFAANFAGDALARIALAPHKTLTIWYSLGLESSEETDYPKDARNQAHPSEAVHNSWRPCKRPVIAGNY